MRPPMLQEYTGTEKKRFQPVFTVGESHRRGGGDDVGQTVAGERTERDRETDGPTLALGCRSAAAWRETRG